MELCSEKHMACLNLEASTCPGGDQITNLTKVWDARWEE